MGWSPTTTPRSVDSATPALGARLDSPRPGRLGDVPTAEGQVAIYNELVRESADRHGADVIDFWRMRAYRDWGLWDPDRMHMGPAGHQRTATAVLDTLGIAHDLEPLTPATVAAAVRRADALREHATWVRTPAAPWVHRRLTGRSSGDRLSPRYATLMRPAED